MDPRQEKDGVRDFRTLGFIQRLVGIQRLDHVVVGLANPVQRPTIEDALGRRDALIVFHFSLTLPQANRYDMLMCETASATRHTLLNQTR